jgi:hypothetical protein
LATGDYAARRGGDAGEVLGDKGYSQGRITLRPFLIQQVYKFFDSQLCLTDDIPQCSPVDLPMIRHNDHHVWMIVLHHDVTACLPTNAETCAL